MIHEHEIPTGSRLYVASCAKQKREFENSAACILEKANFTEIVTPFFSYHQNDVVPEENLIKVADNNNKTFSLRSDSSIDIVRLATKRLEKVQNLFYIQPIFRYPSSEFYQIGAESIESLKLEDIISLSTDILSSIKKEPILQLSNIKIPKLLTKKFKLNIDVFKNAEIDKLFDLKVEWVSALVYASSLEALEDIIATYKSIDADIVKEIKKLIDIAHKIEYNNIKLTPIYFSELMFYKDLYFRLFEGNKTYGLGGVYEIDNKTCTGFSLYTDRILGR